MNPTMMLGAFRSQFSSIMRLPILILFALLPPLVWMTEGSGQPDCSRLIWIAWILGAGIIGRDVSTGVLQLTLVRPITRSQYVSNKYIALGLGVSAVSLLQWIFYFIFCHPQEPAAKIFYAMSECLLAAFGAAAPVILFSSLLPGFADLGLLLFVLVLSQVTSLFGEHYKLAYLSRIQPEVMNFLAPFIDIEKLSRGSVSWFSITSYLSTITVCLALAIVLVNRKELSYGAA